MARNQSGAPPRRERTRRTGGSRVAWVLLALIFTGTVVYAAENLSGSVDAAALLSAKLSVPQGGGELMNAQIRSFSEMLTRPRAAKPAAAVVSAPSVSSSAPVSSAPATSGSSSSAAARPVQSMQLGTQLGGPFETYANISVQRLTTQHASADIKNQLAVKPDLKINLKAAPQVLIIHTHATEAYAAQDSGVFDPNNSFRSTDKTKDMIRVGDEIAKYLSGNGIGVYHDTGLYDYPNYDGAYDRSLTAVKNDLKKYPSIRVVLDIHRDSIQNPDGSRVKPTVTINGRKAAQVMIISGCGEPNSSLTVPDWIWNYRFALRIQQQMVLTYPGLARPVDLVDKQYNEQVGHGALLVEFGSDVNTLDEAVYAGQLFGQALSQVLKGLQE